MYLIHEARFLAPDVKLFRIEAPRVARKRQRRPVRHPPRPRAGRAGSRSPSPTPTPSAATSRSSSRASGRPPSCSTRSRPATRSSTSWAPWGGHPRSRSSGPRASSAGGVGAAIAYPTAVALKKAGNRVISILGGRTRELVVLEDEIRAASDEVIVTTDDGSYGRKGLVTDALQKLHRRRREDRLRAGHRPDPDDAGGGRDHPAPRDPDRGQPELDHDRRHRDVRRLPGEHRRARAQFACVDGPEFDAHRVDFDVLRNRNAMYREKETEALRALPGRPRERAGQRARPPLPAGGCRGGAMSHNPIKPKDRVKIPRASMPEQDPAERGSQLRRGEPGPPRRPRPDRGHPLPRVQEAGLRPRVPGGGEGPGVRGPGPQPGLQGGGGQDARGQRPAGHHRPGLSPGGPVRGLLRPRARSSSPLAIGYLERFIADWEAESGEVGLPPRAPATGKKVAMRRQRPRRPDRRRRPGPEGPRRHRLRGPARDRRRARLRHPRVPPAQGHRAARRRQHAQDGREVRDQRGGRQDGHHRRAHERRGLRRRLRRPPGPASPAS